MIKAHVASCPFGRARPALPGGNEGLQALGYDGSMLLTRLLRHRPARLLAVLFLVALGPRAPPPPPGAHVPAAPASPLARPRDAASAPTSQDSDAEESGNLSAS